MITTRADPNTARPTDLVDRDFSAFKPNQLWVVDFTYVPLTKGTAFAAFITDVYSRRIVGWRVKDNMPTELPLDALEMALWVRQRVGQTLDGLIHHSDAGSQYTATRYSKTITEAGGLCSIGSVGDSYDNAMAESDNGLYKTECVNLDGPFNHVEALEYATMDWVDYYNTDRLHWHDQLHPTHRIRTALPSTTATRSTPTCNRRIGTTRLYKTRSGSGDFPSLLQKLKKRTWGGCP